MSPNGLVNYAPFLARFLHSERFFHLHFYPPLVLHTWFFFSTSSPFVLVSPFLLPIGSLVKLRFFSCPYTLTVLRAARLTLPHWRMKQHAFFYTLINFIRAHSVSSQETVLSEMNQCMVMFRNPADQNKQSRLLVLLLTAQWNDVSMYWISTLGLIITSPADWSVRCCLHKLIKLQ